MRVPLPPPPPKHSNTGAALQERNKIQVLQSRKHTRVRPWRGGEVWYSGENQDGVSDTDAGMLHRCLSFSLKETNSPLDWFQPAEDEHTANFWPVSIKSHLVSTPSSCPPGHRRPCGLGSYIQTSCIWQESEHCSPQHSTRLREILICAKRANVTKDLE